MAPRRTGTVTITPRIDPLTPGDVDRIDLRDVSGPGGKKRGLSKYVPFDAVVVDSYAENVRLQVAVNGREFDPIPEQTARTFDSIPVETIAIKNPSGSGSNVQAENVQLILFTQEKQEPAEFNATNLLKDLIPGVR